MQEIENKKPNVIFTIADSDGLPMLLRNTNDFKDGELPPQVGEVLVYLFTHPLYAMSHISERNDPALHCFAIKNQKELDPLIELVKAEGVKRIHVDACLNNNEAHERLYSLLEIDKVGDFETLIEVLSNTEGCPICHDAERIADELGPDTQGTILRI